MQDSEEGEAGWCREGVDLGVSGCHKNNVYESCGMKVCMSWCFELITSLSSLSSGTF